MEHEEGCVIGSKITRSELTQIQDLIFQDLELDFDLVRRITAELKKEGRLEVV